MQGRTYSVFTYIFYGFLMIFLSKTYNSDKYQKLFIFRFNYNRLIAMWKIGIIVILVLCLIFYYRYGYISQNILILYSIFFILLTTLCLYSIGLYSLFPIKQEQSILYYTLLDLVGSEKEDPNISLNMTYYGLAVLLSRFNKLPAVKFPDVYKMIKQLSQAEDEFSGNQKKTKEDLEQEKRVKQLQEQAEKELERSQNQEQEKNDQEKK
ncbi:hypothetical protein [Psittacicella gerlachiana]|uniref:Transmembrane protein n=1 Tax=Psittacicella gerlachiana TaxID=2028574 RepID=A0A3A1YKH7_9GAMM|nr:hypothetical protein [Psittacicella gerlachiana]RIY38682.1 hypothetical protein CKF59_00410 [Psittacicella gerlachiana]